MQPLADHSSLGRRPARLHKLVATIALALTYWFAAWSPADAQIGDRPDRVSLGLHLDEIFRGSDGIIAKWPPGVQFAVLGSPSQEHREAIERIMASIRKATGLAIGALNDSQQEAVMLFVFTSEFDKLVANRALARTLRQPGESDADLIQRLRNELEPGQTKSTHTRRGYVEQLSVNLASSGVGSGDPTTLALRMGLAGFFDFGTSNVIRPSLMNTGALAVSDLSPVDMAFFAALYDPRIAPRQLYGDVKPLLIDLMLDWFARNGVTKAP